VISFKHLFNPNLRLKTEAYYQWLFDIPVKKSPSFVSMINYGSSFIYGDYDSLINEGTGRNLGIELTFEHFFSRNYYWLMTLSLFDSKYKASDGKIRNTAYNGNFIVNLLGGYEWSLSRQNALSADLKAVWAGGLRSIPIDLEASRAAGRTIYDYSRVYRQRYDDYYRIDIRISLKINRPKTGHLIALDIQNVTNRKNRFLEEYNPDSGQVEQVFQLGILPIILWRMHF
jgi:outer membrane receptor protein involved in Fe transport